ncbi:MAG: lysophospholipid acyltransferase family protein [Balneolaceae bacterium]|jgi:1-acyl-sn-glycerol-3-phosphate acyltransferase
MIKNVRATVRLILFFITTLLTIVFVAVGNFLLGPVGRRWHIAWKNKVIKAWAWLVSWIIGLQVDLKGTPPDPPFLLVSNHLSYIDPLLFWRYLDATFVAKSEVKSWPFFGWGTKTLGVLFIDRELRKDVKRMNERISSSISNVQGVIIFPEGTSTKGKDVKSFNAPLLQYPVDNQMPVHYVSISYKTPNPWPAHMHVCWWGDMAFMSHFWNLLKIPRFKAKVIFGESIIERDRKILADRLHRAVSSSFMPVVKEKEIQ